MMRRTISMLTITLASCAAWVSFDEHAIGVRRTDAAPAVVDEAGSVAEDSSSPASSDPVTVVLAEPATVLFQSAEGDVLHLEPSTTRVARSEARLATVTIAFETGPQLHLVSFASTPPGTTIRIAYSSKGALATASVQLPNSDINPSTYQLLLLGQQPSAFGATSVTIRAQDVDENGTVTLIAYGNPRTSAKPYSLISKGIVPSSPLVASSEWRPTSSSNASLVDADGKPADGLLSGNIGEHRFYLPRVGALTSVPDGLDDLERESTLPSSEFSRLNVRLRGTREAVTANAALPRPVSMEARLDRSNPMKPAVEWSVVGTRGGALARLTGESFVWNVVLPPVALPRHELPRLPQELASKVALDRPIALRVEVFDGDAFPDYAALIRSIRFFSPTDPFDAIPPGTLLTSVFER